jgi:hypothetical protein
MGMINRKFQTGNFKPGNLAAGPSTGSQFPVSPTPFAIFFYVSRR